MFKKLTAYLAIAAVSFGFVGCSEDDKTPVYHVPSQPFVMDTPAFASSLHSLIPDGTTSFTVAQPDYGFQAVVNYDIEVCLNPEGRIINIGSIDPTSTTVTVKDDLFAEAINKLNGIKSQADWDANTAAQAPQKVLVRAVAQLPGVASSLTASEWVTLDQVQPFAAIPRIPRIYLVGSLVGWPEPSEANADKLLSLYDENETGVYTATFTAPGGEIYFRFVTRLGGWGGSSWIGCPDGGNMNVTLPFEGSSSTGDGNWVITPAAGTSVTLTVDTSVSPATVKFEEAK